MALVYQVRSVDAFENVRIIHAYETAEDAQTAISMMKSKTRLRYISVPVENQPDQFWGIDNIIPTT